jgi:hypothetical protein
LDNILGAVQLKGVMALISLSSELYAHSIQDTSYMYSLWKPANLINVILWQLSTWKGIAKIFITSDLSRRPVENSSDKYNCI